MNLHFYKYQATGNDFILADNRNGAYSLTADQIGCHRGQSSIHHWIISSTHSSGAGRVPIRPCFRGMLFTRSPDPPAVGAAAVGPWVPKPSLGASIPISSAQAPVVAGGPARRSETQIFDLVEERSVADLQKFGCPHAVPLRLFKDLENDVTFLGMRRPPGDVFHHDDDVVDQQADRRGDAA